MKKISPLIILALLSQNSWGQPSLPPDEVGIIEKTDIDSSLKAAFLKSIQSSHDHYYIKSVSGDYIHIFNQLKKASEKQIDSRQTNTNKCFIGDDFEVNGIFFESKFRETYFFNRHKNYRAMLTLWNVAESGGLVSFPKYLVNDKIDNTEVLTVLAIPLEDALKRAIWKSTWHKNGTLFELYIETRIDSPLAIEYSYNNVAKSIRSIKCSH